MPMIPMKQSVTIRRKGEPDRWGESSEETFSLKCRFEEGAKMTRRTSAQTGATAISSEEVVSVGDFIFDKNADVRLTDELHYTDESGITTKYLPLNKKRIRGLNGKSLLLKVEV